MLSAEDAERVASEQARTALPFASVALRMGLVDEPTLVNALAEHFGVPGVDLGASTIDGTLLGLIPEQVARSHQILPLSESDQMLILAMATPDARGVIDEIAFATGREVLPHVAIRAQLADAIDSAYAARRSGQTLVWRGPRATAGVSTLTPSPRSPGLEVEFPEEAFAGGTGVEVPKPDGSGRPRVLAVDDEESILDIIDRTLSHRGMEVVRATRGRRALELLRSTSPNIILLDAMLPEIHGFELCGTIKRSERFKDVPVMIISAVYTGWNFAQDIKRLYGADDYLEKPFRVGELIRRVENLLAKTSAKPPMVDVKESIAEAELQTRKAAEAYKAGRLDEALDAAQRAVVADPFDARAHFVLGSVQQARGQVIQAITSYERVAEIEPALFSALKNLAVLYERQGFRAKAVETWMRALDQSPSDAVRQTIKAHLIGLL